MTSQPIREVFVAGSGQMGHGIAQVIACAGLQVILYDVAEPALQSALEKMRWSLEKLHSKGRIAEAVDTILSHVTTTCDLSLARTCDLVIEAIPEEETLKRNLFQQLNDITPSHVLFASNTSAIRISTIASATQRADRFGGLHFFNPVPVMPLVEVVRGELTSESTLTSLTAFSERIGKQPVQVRGDQAGFIVNRILGAAMIEAIRILEAGQADAAEIDKAMRLGCGWKMGPLETADLAGLDIVMRMCDVMQQGNTSQVFTPPASLRDHVNQGKLGRKSGQGFYVY